MRIVGWILFILGGGTFLLDSIGMMSLIPPLARAGVPTAVWGGIGLVGMIMAMMFRRPAD